MEGAGHRLSELEVDGHIASIISQGLLFIEMGIGSQLIADLSQQAIDSCKEKLKADYEC